MSWAKITNKKIVLTVPYQAFIDIYKFNGFEIVEEEDSPTQVYNEEKESANVERTTESNSPKYKVPYKRKTTVVKRK